MNEYILEYNRYVVRSCNYWDLSGGRVQIAANFHQRILKSRPVN